ncbi:MAG: glycosyltransferase [Bacteroidetes bacterium]|nr:glycosyltransferase [Bacteroidota bacterium]
MQAPNIVFLYTEIAPYFLACCNALASQHDASVHIIRYPVNEEAPFVFSTQQKIHLYNRKNYDLLSLLSLLKKINPSIIVCSGWIDKEYLQVCKSYFKKIPTVLTLDTHWRGDFKQHIAVLLSPFFIKNKFSHAWVPGTAQKKYAKKLGFKEEKITLNFYSCDWTYFSSLEKKITPKKQQNFPKRFIYTGRYYDFKGLGELWNAFIELQKETPNEWELWCIGTGTLQPAEHPKIKHYGFVQPCDFLPYVQQTGVFVMPSLFEPWGVVLHEFATMGYPLIASDKVGASEAFLQENKNGFIFEAGNVFSLKEKMKTIIQMPPEQLLLMGEYSKQAAQKITPEIWANNLMTMI